MTLSSVKRLFRFYKMTAIFPFDSRSNYSVLSLLGLLSSQMMCIFLIIVVINKKNDFIKDHGYDPLFIGVQLITVISMTLSDTVNSITTIFVGNFVKGLLNNFYVSYGSFLKHFKVQNLNLNYVFIKLIVPLIIYFAVMLYFAFFVPFNSLYHGSMYFYYLFRTFRIIVSRSFITSILYYLNMNISLNTKVIMRFKHVLSHYKMLEQCKFCYKTVNDISRLFDSSLLGLQTFVLMIVSFVSVLGELFRSSKTIRANFKMGLPPAEWQNNFYFYMVSFTWASMFCYNIWDVIASTSLAAKLVHKFFHIFFCPLYRACFYPIIIQLVYIFITLPFSIRFINVSKQLVIQNIRRFKI